MLGAKKSGACDPGHLLKQAKSGEVKKMPEKPECQFPAVTCQGSVIMPVGLFCRFAGAGTKEPLFHSSVHAFRGFLS